MSLEIWKGFLKTSLGAPNLCRGSEDTESFVTSAIQEHCQPGRLVWKKKKKTLMQSGIVERAMI